MNLRSTIRSNGWTVTLEQPFQGVSKNLVFLKQYQWLKQKIFSCYLLQLFFVFAAAANPLLWECIKHAFVQIKNIAILLFSVLSTNDENTGVNNIINM